MEEESGPTGRSSTPSSGGQTTGSASPKPSAIPSATATQNRSGTERILADKWYVDSDGNEVPDFIEAEEGFDPASDECAKKVDCPGLSEVAGTSAVDLVSKEQNTILILDASGSMAEPIGAGQTKMDAAKASLQRYATGTPDFINLGFMVYGHKGSSSQADKAASCASAEMLEPLGKVDFRTFDKTLSSFQPSGWTPIAGALNEVGDAFSGEAGATNRVILVSDGVGTCGGDPVAAAQQLADEDINVTIDVVGFDIPGVKAAQLQQIAEVTGGGYTTVRSEEELQDYFGQQRLIYRTLRDQLSCVAREGREVYGCYDLIRRETTALMYRLERGISHDSEDGQERKDAVRQIASKANDYLRSAYEESSQETRARIAEIDEDLQQARQRMNQRFEESVSFSPTAPCPHPDNPRTGSRNGAILAVENRAAPTLWYEEI
ncbi:hypothetical protein GCM10027402_03260 [Arthrobacter monumenti]